MRKPTVVVLALATVLAGGACSDRPSFSNPYSRPSPTSRAPDAGKPLATLPRGPQPSFGATRQAAIPPPAIAGGTLLVLRDGRAVAADADRDRIFIVDVGERRVSSVALQPGDEPGRVVEDGDGRVHVVLRRAGAVVTIDPTSAVVLARRGVCPSPRGVALQAPKARLLVACEGGELVALEADPSSAVPPAIVARPGTDLRDVVVTGGRVFVSRLRSAEILELSPSFGVVSRALAALADPKERPMLALRMIAPAEGDPVPDPIVVHSIARDPQPPSPSQPPSYQGTSTQPGGASSTGLECAPGRGPVVTSALTRAGVAGGTVRAPDHATLPVDVAVDATSIAIVAAGNGHTTSLPQVYTFAVGAMGSTPKSSPSTACAAPRGAYRVQGQAVAVAFRRANALIVQSREPAELELLPEGVRISLSTESREDTGHAIFHSNSGAGLACASCHAEGGDDGRVWKLDSNGPTRTPSLRGTLAGTAPFHWRGDLPDLASLADVIMSGRMNGPLLDSSQKAALEGWLFSLPAPRVAPPGEAATRGRALFESDSVGCASCHSGPRFTNAATLDVGTGGAFQVPSLVGVSLRTPLLHNGCAPTLRDRFGACGGSNHGNTTQLDGPKLDDLVAYLESL